jgi:MFS-type transporter involved in bile tolerance (Atg22 family)
MSQFTSQVSFLLLITVISIVFGLKAVVAAQVSQAVDAVFSGVFFYYSWKLMEEVPARHVLKEGKSLLTEGFVQVARTVRDINRSHKKGTRWFFLAVTCAEAGANAFTVVAVVFLAEELEFSSLEIGIFFIVSLVFSIPGSMLGTYVTMKLDPKRSWCLVMVLLFLWSSIGAVVLEFLPEHLSFLSFLWGSGIGLFLGWFYPVENLFFAMCLPKGQEAELSGFFVYCSQILGWLPPLIFSIMVEAKVGQTYGVVAVSGFLLLAAGIISCAAPWPEILEDCGRGLKGTEVESADDSLKQNEEMAPSENAPDEEL